MNQLIRAPQNMPTTQDGWTWDGQQWICCDGSDGGQQPGCPPIGFPPRGCFPWFPPPQGQPPWYPGANAGVSFSQTAPPNPTRGHFWWDGTTLRMFDGAAWVVIGGSGGGGGGGSGAGTVVISSTAPGNPMVGSQWWDGSTLRMWDGAQWVAIGPGSAAGPVPTTTIVFAITNQTPKTIASGQVWTIVPFIETPQVDTMTGYDSITHKYKPSKPGMYDFGIRGLTDGVAVVKNDSGTFASGTGSDIVVSIASEAAGSGEWIQGSGISLMNGTTDFVRMWARSNAGSMGATGPNPAFSAILLP